MKRYAGDNENDSRTQGGRIPGLDAVHWFLRWATTNPGFPAQRLISDRGTALENGSHSQLLFGAMVGSLLQLDPSQNPTLPSA
jgi:hypothetical protein